MCDIEILDSNCRPWLVLQVGTDGRPAFGRSLVQVFDSEGRLSETITPRLSRQIVIRNSMDQPVQETSLPLTRRYDEDTKTVSTKYNADGRVTERIVSNSPMAVFTCSMRPAPSTLFPIEPSRVSVPQVMAQEYDEFGRLWTTKMPDGLVKTNDYNAGSMVETITSTHLENRRFSEIVRLEYDSVRRVCAVKDESKATLQSFRYDDFGNVIYGEDRANPRCTVTVTRRFDNLGNILYESTLAEGGPREVQIGYDYALTDGTRRLGILGLKGQRAALWQQMEYRSDLDGRVTSIAVDSNDRFCQYKYVGAQVIHKTLPEGGIELSIGTSALLEPQSYSLNELGARRVVSRTNYHLDAHGLVDASAADVPQMEWQRSQFYQHDSHCTLVGEASEDRLCTDLEARRETVLHDLTCPSSWRARWSQLRPGRESNHNI